MFKLFSIEALNRVDNLFRSRSSWLRVGKYRSVVNGQPGHYSSAAINGREASLFSESPTR